MQIKGIDVSRFQADDYGNTLVDFAKLKKKGYNFVMIRAGLGKYLSQKDKAFESHYKAAKAAGLHIGAYHYTYARNVQEAKQEAMCFLNWIQGKKLDYPVVLDMEDESLTDLSRKELTDIADAYMSETEAAGYYTMLYTNPDWITNRLDITRLARYDIWLACWTSEKRRKQLYTRKTLGIWQHGTAKLGGVFPKGKLIGEPIDADIAYMDYASVIKRAKLNNL